MYNDPYKRVAGRPVLFSTMHDYSYRHRKSLPESFKYLDQYVDGSYFVACHSLGEVAGLSKANTTRLGGSLGNFINRHPDTIGSMFSLPAETVLFYAVDKRPKTTRHINVCAVAAVAIMGCEKPSVPRIPGLGVAIIEPLIEGLARYPEEVQQRLEKYCTLADRVAR